MGLNIFELASKLAVLLVGRNPEWGELSIPTDGATVPSTIKGRPLNGNAGKGLGNAPKCLIHIACREDLARFGTRVRVTAVDDTATYTVTVNSLDHAYACSGGEDEEAILDGVEAIIDDGVAITTGDLTFGGVAGAYTITRASGDWGADGATAGTQVLVTGTNSPGTYTIASVDSASVVTLEGEDVVSAATETPTTVKLRAQVTAAVETRDDVATLVIKTKHGKDQYPDEDDVLKAAELADETTTHTITLAATGTGDMEYDKDASTCDVIAFLLPGGSGGDKPEGEWARGEGATWEGVTKDGVTQRLSTAGYERVDASVANADGIVRIRFGPAVDE